jgi:FkbM family methyltransferase
MSERLRISEADMALRRLAAQCARKHSLPARLLAELQARKFRGREYAESCRLAKPGTLAVDVGAYVGTFAIGLSKAVGRAGLVLALEPQPAVYRELVKATWGARVVALNVAASDRAGWAQLAVPFDAWNNRARQRGSLGPLTEHVADSMRVRLARLDDLIGPSLPVSLLKIDVEGHESEALAGATETIAEHHPALVIEVEQRHLGPGKSVAEVIKPLLEAGYNCQFIGRGDRLLPWSEFDVEADQLRWLTEEGDLRPEHVNGYGNNFLFT